MGRGGNTGWGRNGVPFLFLRYWLRVCVLGGGGVMLIVSVVGGSDCRNIGMWCRCGVCDMSSVEVKDGYLV